MSPVNRSGPPGEALHTPDPLLPLRDADVADIPFLFASASERMREVAIRFNQSGPAADPLMNLLNEGLSAGHDLDEAGTHYYNAGLLYAFLIAQRKYKEGFGGPIPALDADAYQRGSHAVRTSREYVDDLAYPEPWKRARAQEARYVGSNALSLVFAPISRQVRQDLAVEGIHSEVDVQALHLGMVEGTIFMGAALGDPWSSEIQEFPVVNKDAVSPLSRLFQQVEDVLNQRPETKEVLTPSAEELAGIKRDMHVSGDNMMLFECRYGGRNQIREAMAALVIEQVGPGEFRRRYNIMWVAQEDLMAPPTYLGSRSLGRAALFAAIMVGADVATTQKLDLVTVGIGAFGVVVGLATGRSAPGRNLRSVEPLGRVIEAPLPGI
ncbi:MAG TPA: hypothetical protein VL737_02380 [Candidatus Pristimantibacillus sp.]|nr:hypothetical protein [Candidatus Pristimantibacillus sp.]